MAKEPHGPTAPPPEIVRLGYEPTGVSLKALTWFVVIFIGTALVLNVLLWFLMAGAIAHEAKHDRSNSVLADMRMPPPKAPPLQPSRNQPEGHRQVPAADLQEMYYEEDGLFSRMGWRPDPNSHAVTIPDDVVKKVAEEAKARSAAARENAATRPAGGGPTR